MSFVFRAAFGQKSRPTPWQIGDLYESSLFLTVCPENKGSIHEDLRYPSYPASTPVGRGLPARTGSEDCLDQQTATGRAGEISIAIPILTKMINYGTHWSGNRWICQSRAHRKSWRLPEQHQRNFPFPTPSDPRHGRSLRGERKHIEVDGCETVARLRCRNVRADGT